MEKSGAIASRSLEGRAIAEIVRELERELAHGGCERPALDVRLLFTLGIGVDTPALEPWPDRPLTAPELERLDQFIPSIRARVPIPYLVGQTRVGAIRVDVGPDVLVPGPETELLIDMAVALATSCGADEGTLVDVCTGSGAIAVCLAARLPRSRVYATDLSPAALAVARRNAERMGLAARVHTLLGDLLGPLEAAALTGKTALIACNPPYVRQADIAKLPLHLREHTPRLAIDGGPDGLRLHERVIGDAWRFLVPGGHLILENEDGQSEEVQRLLLRDGKYRVVDIGRNAQGVPRVVVAQRTG